MEFGVPEVLVVAHPAIYRSKGFWGEAVEVFAAEPALADEACVEEEPEVLGGSRPARFETCSQSPHRRFPVPECIEQLTPGGVGDGVETSTSDIRACFLKHDAIPIRVVELHELAPRCLLDTVGDYDF